MSIAKTLPLPEPVPILSSGEVGTTVIETITVVEHAVRRCGQQVNALTAEQLETAKSNLHFILASLSNRGVNLWAVDRQLVPLVHGQSAYTLPTGTEKIVNIMYRTNRELPSVSKILGGLPSCSVVMEQVQEFNLVGFKLPAEFNGRLVMEYVDAFNNWTPYRNFDDISLASGWHWYAFDPGLKSNGFRIRDTEDRTLKVDDLILCDSSTDRDITRLNRDQYTAIPDKMRKGKPNAFFFDKQIESRIVLWPVPEDEKAQLIIWRLRRIHDVGTLAQKLEVPDRWFEAIIWALAKNLSFELPGVAQDRIQMCIGMAKSSLEDAELGESDQAPIYIQPDISGYTS